MHILYEYFLKWLVNGKALVNAGNDPLHIFEMEPIHRVGGAPRTSPFNPHRV